MRATETARGRLRRARVPALLSALLLGWAPAVDAQSRGEVVGVVRDEDGRGLAHAQVVLTETGRGTLTGGDGRFRLTGLPPGAHRLEVSRIGYAPERREVEVRVGERVSVELRLERTPLSLPGVMVTATPGSRESLAVTQATTQLSGRALERELGATVAQTLRAQPGIAVRSMGPAATAPVMRGLTGDRILVLQDGQRTADLAGSADDHGVTIDPLAAQRVEVVRGPATLLYGNNALGGVVNVISGDIPTMVSPEAEWQVSAQTETAYPGGSVSARGSVPLGGGWVVGVRGGGRSTGDMRIPEDPVLGDELENTQFRNWNAAAGLGHAGDAGVGGLALRLYRFEYGLPVPPGSDPVNLDGGRTEVLGRWAWGRLRVDATVQDYAHDELDAPTGEVLQTFALDTRTLNAQVRQERWGPFAEGAWGASLLSKRYAATGPAALTPPADSRAIGIFGFQELTLPWGGAALQLGGRIDRYVIESSATEKHGPAVRRVFDALSGSVGARVPLAEGVSLAASVARSFRAPTVEELFSGAAHAGTGSVEFGDPELDAERGTSAEVVLRTERPDWNGQIAFYRNAIDDYVHLVSRGDTLLEGVRLPVLGYAASRAVLRGVEGSIEWAVRPEIVIGAMGDYLHAEQDDGTPLSFMPPPRIGVLARWDDGRFTVGADAHHELRQGRVGAADESPTPAHTVARVTAGVRFSLGGRIHSLTVRGENLTNELHREATSRIKDFAPGPGRNLALVYRLIF